MLLVQALFFGLSLKQKLLLPQSDQLADVSIAFVSGDQVAEHMAVIQDALVEESPGFVVPSPLARPGFPERLAFFDNVLH